MSLSLSKALWIHHNTKTLKERTLRQIIEIRDFLRTHVLVMSFPQAPCVPEALVPCCRLPMKSWEGHIFTSVCLSTGGVGVSGPTSLAGDGYTRGMVYRLGGWAFQRGEGMPEGWVYQSGAGIPGYTPHGTDPT